MENFATYRLTQTGPETQAILDQVNENTTDIAQLRALYEALTQSEPVIIQPSDTWPVADPEENVIYRVIDRVNTPPESYSDYMWNGTAMILMATYDNAIDSTPTAGSNNTVASGGVLDYVSTNGSAYDISAANSGTAYAGLSAALGTDGANVPAAVRKGGMSVKFILSSDNKYVQYRYMLQYENTTAGNNAFKNIANWQGVDEKVTALSRNLIESGAVFIPEKMLEGLTEAVESDCFSNYEEYDCILGNGTWGVSYGKHIIVPVIAGEKYAINPVTFDGQYGFLTSSHSEPVTNGSTAAMVSGTKRETAYVNSGVTIIEIPEGAVYLCMNTVNGARQKINWVFSKLSGLVLKEVAQRLIMNEAYFNAIEIPSYYYTAVSVNSGTRVWIYLSKILFSSEHTLTVKPTSISGYKFAIGTIKADGSYIGDTGWQISETSLKGDDLAEYFRIYVAKTDGTSTLTVDEGLAYIESIKIKGDTIDDLVEEIDDKVSKEDGKSLINSDVADNIDYIEDEDWSRLEVDNVGSILSGTRKKNGNHYIRNVESETIDELKEQLKEMKSGTGFGDSMQKLYMGTLEQQTGYVRTAPSYVLPNRLCKFKLICTDENLIVQVVTDLETITLVDNDWVGLANSNSFMYYVKISGANATISHVEELISKGSFAIVYKDSDIYASSSAIMPYLKASIYKRNSSVAARGDDQLPVFFHVTDQHGDAIRTQRAFELADLLKADGVFLTGDAVKNSINDDSSYQLNIAKDGNVTPFFCIGNHECMTSGTVDVSTIYNRHMKGLSDKYGYIHNSNDTDKTYYYYDIAKWNIRIIALNCFEPLNGAYSGATRYTQAQINWLISTLANTPAGYGVIILQHYYENALTFAEGEKEFKDIYSVAGGVSYHSVSQIVDAFISKTTINTTVIQNNNSEDVLTLQGDFSNVANNTEFLFYAVGHTHRDACGYYADTVNKQLVCCLVCACPLYGHFTPDSSYNYRANDGDLVRGGEGSTQDAINVYAVDRARGVIIISRVGANMTYEYGDRKHLALEYK